MTRVTLKALVVLEVFCRDTVIGLITDQCDDLNSFSWMSQLRYYWEGKD